MSGVQDANRFVTPAMDRAGTRARPAPGKPGSQPPTELRSLRIEPADREAWFQKAVTERCASSRCSQLRRVRDQTAPAATRRIASVARADLVAHRGPCGFPVPWPAVW